MSAKGLNHKELADQFVYSAKRIKRHMNKIYPQLKGKIYTEAQWVKIWLCLIEEDVKKHIREVKKQKRVNIINDEKN